jgi:hypothetical protein
MEFKPVSWSIGESFNEEKIRQMIVNDEVIHNLYLKTIYGPMASDTYFDQEASGSISASPGSWVDIITLDNVFLYPSRWVKISAIVHGAASQTRGTYIPFRVLMDGTEVLYMRTPDGSLGGTQKWCSVSGARIMQPQPGTHTFKLQLGNDYSGATTNTFIHNIGPKNPTILSIDDLGGIYV